MKHILVVEDSAMVSKVIGHVLSQSRLLHVDFVINFEQARQKVGEKSYFAAVVDLNLPDASNGEVVDFMRQRDIPTIVLTSTFDEKRRISMLKKGIVDYVTKEGRYSYELVLHTVERLIKNESIKVLVVDDSSMQRKLMTQLLKLHLFQVLEAKDGIGAIKMILQNPGIKLVITDYNMPNMDGFELIKNIRAKYEKSDLIMIGVSSEGEGALSAKFIKYGANDFLNKPFNQEEFFCRVNHNIEFLELIEQVKDTANRDDVTDVYTARYFFAKAQAMYQKAKDNEASLAAAVIDVEEISGDYTAEMSEHALKVVAKRLDDAFSRFFIGRGDGRQFLVLMPGLTLEKAMEYVEQIRQLVASERIYLTDSDSVNLGLSAGVSCECGDDIDDLLDSARDCLTRAIDAGGDLVVGD